MGTSEAVTLVMGVAGRGRLMVLTASWEGVLQWANASLPPLYWYIVEVIVEVWAYRYNKRLTQMWNGNNYLLVKDT